MQWLTHNQYKKVHQIIQSWYLKVFADFLVPGSFIAITADTNSVDTVWFIEIAESSFVGDRVLCDDHGHKIAAGVNFLKGHSLKKEKEF